MQSICVFCGSSAGNKPLYRQATIELGVAIARHGWDLVWGGGHIGLMGVVADAVLDAGGKAIGVIPEFLAQRELAHKRAEILVVDSMHERKALMAERAGGFVVLPGGFGTMDEFFEILTWAQLSIHAKPIGLLNAGGFFDPLVQLVHHMVREGFVHADHLHLIHVAHGADALLDTMSAYAAKENLGQI